jgi:hypothetical protein
VAVNESVEEVKSSYLVKVALEIVVTLVDDSPSLLYNAIQKPLEELTEEEMQQFYISLKEVVKEQLYEYIDNDLLVDLFNNIDTYSVSKIS